MAKKDTQPVNTEPEITSDIKDMMGLPPEEAAPVLSKDNQQIIDPGTLPIPDESTPANNELNLSDDKAEPILGDTTKEPDSVNQNSNLDDADKIVDEIVAKEGDDLLAADDAKTAAQEPKKPKKTVGYFFKAWWGHKRIRTITILAVIAILVAVALIPFTRYKILNIAHVRASLSLQIIDQKSGFPIKNVEVVAGGVKGQTDDSGKVTLYNVKLGKTKLELTKRSFAPLSQSIVVGWGSNPYVDPFQMNAVGSNYSFIVKDALSDKPIAKAEVTDGESVALSDDNGMAVLTIQPQDNDVAVTIKSKDYRDQQMTLTTTDSNGKTVLMMADRPDVFVSKRSGKYDLYKRDVDGKNEVVLLAGSGSEQESLSLLVQPNSNIAAYASSRDGKRNKDGYLLSNLYMVDVMAKTVTKIEGTESEQIQLIDWVGDKLIFVKIVAGPSGNTAGRQRIISYDVKQDKQTELASANYFNDIEVFKGKLYYATNGIAQLVRINVDNTAKVTLLNQETWAIYRTGYDKIQVNAANNKWYEQNLADNTVTALSGAPATPTHRTYADNPSSTFSVWLDTRDGKGVLLLQDIKAGTEKVIATKSGLNYPARFISDKHLIVRVTNSSETADYILNIEGGDMQKIGDVTSTAPTNRWYYY